MHVRSFGEGPPLVALHGFTSTGEQFASLAADVGRRIHAPDLPGHGRSVPDPTGFDDVTASLVAYLQAFDRPPPLLGYSQGGRVAIGALARTPSCASSLIVVSATAGIEGHSERAARKSADEHLADHIVEIGTGRFLTEWTSEGLTSTVHLPDPSRDRDLAIRHKNTAKGLAAALRGFGQGVQPSLWVRLPMIAIPTLVVAGERDEKYVSIAHRLVGGLPNATLHIVDEAGHNPFLDRPEPTAAAISGFLDRHG